MGLGNHCLVRCIWSLDASVHGHGSKGVVQLKATERAFVDNMEGYDYLGSIVGAGLSCVAVYLLFRLRKSAVVAFWCTPRAECRFMGYIFFA